jgi:hypothetical protein
VVQRFLFNRIDVVADHPTVGKGPEHPPSILPHAPNTRVAISNDAVMAAELAANPPTIERLIK